MRYMIYFLMSCIVLSAQLSAEVVEYEEGVVVNMGDLSLEFPKHGKWLLGLASAEVSGYALTSAETVMKPLIAQEFKEAHGGVREMWPFLQLESVEEGDDGSIILVCGLYGGSAEALYRAHYVWKGDRKPVLAKPSADLIPLQDAAEKAQQAFDVESAQVASVIEAQTVLEKSLQRDRERKRPKESGKTRRARDTLRKATRTAEQELAGRNPIFAQHAQTIATWRAALDQAAMNFGDLKRDHYAFPVVQLPAELMTVAGQRALHDALAQETIRRGTLRWVLNPKEQVIAGWPWQGWSQHYQVELDDGLRTTVVYQIGTWELAGHLNDLTLGALRYRGLGRIEHRFSGREGIAEAFSTTEILPGAAGGAPLISPVVPPSSTDGQLDRGKSLAHRIAAWIVRPARGGGSHFFDFQFRPEAGLIAFPDRQGDLRAVTEAMPGDRYLSQTDEERFALSARHTTIPMNYLVLLDTQTPFGVNDWRTRWKEWDQHLRDVVSDELGFVHPQPLPGIGVLKEYGRPGFYRHMAKNMKDWAAKGLRLVASHTPGWWSPQHPTIDGKRGRGGNSNAIYDWKPTHDMHEPWKVFQEACERYGVRYHSYLTGMVRNDGPFFQEVGADDRHWGRNKPGSDYSHGYPPILNGMGIFSEQTSRLLDQRIMAIREEFGTQGIWADSFQNMYLSQLSWGDDTAAPQQRLWWEKLAQWSQKGILFMSESHAFPGLSCSIEVPDWDQDLWYFQYVWKWHRGTSQNHIKPERLDEMCFMAMANRGWTGPDGSPDPIPSFEIFAQSYNLALPRMQRPYILPDASGVLWLDDESRQTGILFSIEAGSLPGGVRAKHLLDGKELNNRPRQRVLDVKADDLLKAFAIRIPPLKDVRQQITIPEPRYR